MVNMKKLQSLLLILILSFPLASFSQLFNFQTYSLDEGLSQSEVNTIFEDSRGYLWIGTSGGGLNRFDGKNFKIYEEKDGVCGQIINAVSEDEQQNIWIGTRFNALCKFDGKTFKSYSEQHEKYFSSGYVQFITKDDNKNLIVIKNHQILLYDGKTFTELRVKGDTLNYYDVNCYKRDSRNIIWIGTDRGLLVLKNKTLLRISDNEKINNANITSVSEDKNGNLWAVQDRSVFHKIKIIGPSHYQVKATQIDSISLPSTATVSDIHFDQQNQLWIATQNEGLYKLNKNNLLHFNQMNGMPVDHINCIYEDKTGNLWIGTAGGGLVKFTNQAFTYFDNLIGLNEKDIFALNADKKGNIWVGTSLHGLFKYDGKTVTHYPAMNETRCIFTDSKGNVWIANNQGISIYNGTSFIPYKYKEVKNVRAIFEDKNGNIFIGTRASKAFVDNGKELIQLTEAVGLLNDNVYSFVEDKNGHIWMGTGNGIFVYNHEKIIKHITKGLCNTYAGSMVKDKFGNIWVGTDNCVGWYNGDEIKSITTKEGLTSGTVYLMNVDNYGNIWVGTNKGLDKISLNDKGEVAGIRNYGKAEGFKGIECNSRSTCIDANGDLWFGTIKGAIKFSPAEELLRNREVPRVSITNVKLFYEEVENWQEYSDTLSHWYNLPINTILPHNKNHITFDFHAISKTFPDNIKYSFKLEGFDKNWSPANEFSTTTYSNLPPGVYHFLVKAENKDGVANEEFAEFSFTITPPFWTTWWFIIICIIAFILSIYGYNEFRKRKHLLQKERLEKIIRDRTAEIIKKRDENEILLKEVHHRVKNNLQIINSLINIQSDYVSDPKATELFREIRNRIRTISLVHEKLYKSEDYGRINVKEYINMLVENLIDTYSYNKKIDLKLDLEVQHFNLNTIIPLGLLLNEIISNSFKYAFNDMNEGVIEIELHKSNIKEEYTIIIGDNGKGFSNEVFDSETTTLGLELIKILASQLNGNIEKIQKPGTHYILKFSPIKD